MAFSDFIICIYSHRLTDNANAHLAFGGIMKAIKLWNSIFFLDLQYHKKLWNFINTKCNPDSTSRRTL